MGNYHGQFQEGLDAATRPCLLGVSAGATFLAQIVVSLVPCLCDVYGGRPTRIEKRANACDRGSL